jgi:Protein of unknown function (DUF4231)
VVFKYKISFYIYAITFENEIIMNEQDYIKQRLDDQINWYSKKSATNKKWYRLCQFSLIVLAALVTLSGLFPAKDFPFVTYTVPTLGAIIAILTGVLALFKFQDNWLTYRLSSEALKHEKYLFLAKSEPYNVENPFNLLVSRCESIMVKENMTWEQAMKPVAKEKK